MDLFTETEKLYLQLFQSSLILTLLSFYVNVWFGITIMCIIILAILYFHFRVMEIPELESRRNDYFTSLLLLEHIFTIIILLGLLLGGIGILIGILLPFMITVSLLYLKPPQPPTDTDTTTQTV